MTKEKKEIEYEDAPSGFVMMYNYKEPFMPFSYEGTGYGYQGVLLFDGNTDKVQCHFCGDWFEFLPAHIAKEHNLKAKDYKDIVGLRQTTALISEKLRSKLISRGQKRFSNLKPGIGARTEEQKEKIRQTMLIRKRETENEKGTCPFQLIDRLTQRAKELGRCPTTYEINFEETLRRVFGTFANACKEAGLTPLKPGQTHRQSKYTKDYFYPIALHFYEQYGKFPKAKDFINLGLGKHTPKFYTKFKTEIEKEILIAKKVFHRAPVRMRLTKDELLQILRNFIEVNGREPSISDCRRGLLPHASRYYYQFGSLKNALKLI